MMKRLHYAFLERFDDATPLFANPEDLRGDWLIRHVNALEMCWGDALRFGWRIALLNLKWVVVHRYQSYSP